jgi:ADP-ribosylglycohydrolase
MDSIRAIIEKIADKEESVLGAIIGDIVGSRFEFDNHRSKEFDFFTAESFVTDDSIMTLAVAKALKETELKAAKLGLTSFDEEYLVLLRKNTIHYMQTIGRKYPDCGYGLRFNGWIFSDDPKPYDSFGNGAAMRISPVGFFARSEKDVITLSDVITAVSHNHPEGIKGARATALAVYMARKKTPMEQIKRRIERDYYLLDFTIDELRPTYRFNETSQETVPQALQCFFESTSFEDAIRIAVSLGGDTDTIAAIVGGIAEAYYGIPEEMKERALGYLDDELLEIYHSI